MQVSQCIGVLLERSNEVCCRGGPVDETGNKVVELIGIVIFFVHGGQMAEKGVPQWRSIADLVVRNGGLEHLEQTLLCTRVLHQSRLVLF